MFLCGFYYPIIVWKFFSLMLLSGGCISKFNLTLLLPIFSSNKCPFQLFQTGFNCITDIKTLILVAKIFPRTFYHGPRFSHQFDAVTLINDRAHYQSLFRPLHVNFSCKKNFPASIQPDSGQWSLSIPIENINTPRGFCRYLGGIEGECWFQLN